MNLTRGTLIDEKIYSPALIRWMRVRVYVPPGYSRRGRYPAIYLLHPWGADETYWTDTLQLHDTADRLISAGALPPFIAIMPQGDKSFFINADNPGGDFSMVLRLDPEHFEGALEGFGDYGDYVVRDLIASMERKYRVREEDSARVIAGMGMGGTGAAVLGFSHPHLFGTVGIHSPVLYNEYRLGPPWIFGLGDPEAFSQRDPASLVKRLPTGMRDIKVYLDGGFYDENIDRVEALRDALSDRRIRHTYEAITDNPITVVTQREKLARYLGFYVAGW